MRHASYKWSQVRRIYPLTIFNPVLSVRLNLPESFAFKEIQYIEY